MADKKYIIDNEKLMAEWDRDKNSKNGLDPKKITYGSNKKASWICSKCGYSWLASIDKRTRINNPTGCPVCGHRIIVTGYNDLETWCNKNNLQYLLEEWDYDKNIDTPSTISSKNGDYRYWKCSVCGNNYKAKVYSRTYGSGCPNCNKTNQTSFPEQIIYYYIKQVYPNTINSYKPTFLKNNSEIDIYIPDLNLAIEYDGNKWHEDTERDIKKDILILKNKINLIRIRESKLKPLNDGSFCIIANETPKDYSYMCEVICQIANYINTNYGYTIDIDVNIDRDITRVKAVYKQNQQTKSLAMQHPELLDDWDYEKNGGLSPYQVKSGEDTLVHWKCSKCGYEWIASIGSRSQGHGCIVCSKAKNKLIVGVNDFENWSLKNNISLLEEWDYEANEKLPSQVSAHSNKKYYWKCSKCGKQWEARISDRTSKNSGCQYCSGKIVRKGINDLATVNPELAKEWDNEKNKNGPENYLPNSNVKVWWKCSVCGNEWQNYIYKRNLYNQGCKKCVTKRSGKSVINIDNGIIYSTIAEAAKETGIHRTAISACCRGARKTAGGYHWKYAE